MPGVNDRGPEEGVLGSPMNVSDETIVTIVQARTGSSRLPGKVLSSIVGRPMLEHQLERLKLSRLAGPVVVATTEDRRDRPLLDLANRLGAQGFVGSEEDVLDRFYRAAGSVGASVVVRVTGDCPLLCPDVLDDLVRFFFVRRPHIDYVGLTEEWPRGFGVEVFTASALERAWREASEPSEREHVTPYIIFSGQFRIERMPCEEDLSWLSLTVDELEDLDRVERILQELLPGHGYRFGMEEIVEAARRFLAPGSARTRLEREDGFVESLRAELPTLEVRPLRTDDEPVPTMERASGSRVWDREGRDYLDYWMGGGSIILGHDDPKVSEHVARTSQRADIHRLEGEVGEALLRLCPWAEVVELTTSGDEALRLAVARARRAGGGGVLVECPPGAVGDRVPIEGDGPLLRVPYGESSELERALRDGGDDVAAVVIRHEPMNEVDRDYLCAVRELASERGTLLIFDEIENALRLGRGGAHSVAGIEPDLVCVGETISNGTPLGAVLGRRAAAAPLGSRTPSVSERSREGLSAANLVVERLVEAEAWERLRKTGHRLKERYNRLAADLGLTAQTACVGVDPHASIVFTGHRQEEMRTLFAQEVTARGVLFCGRHYVSLAHTNEDLRVTTAAYLSALESMREVVRREGA